MNANPEVTGRKMSADAIGVEPLAYRIKDACKVLSVSRSHLYALAAKGEVNLIHIGGSTRVPKSEIRRLLGEVGEAA